MSHLRNSTTVEQLRRLVQSRFEKIELDNHFQNHGNDEHRDGDQDGNEWSQHLDRLVAQFGHEVFLRPSKLVLSHDQSVALGWRKWVLRAEHSTARLRSPSVRIHDGKLVNQPSLLHQDSMIENVVHDVIEEYPYAFMAWHGRHPYVAKRVAEILSQRRRKKRTSMRSEFDDSGSMKSTRKDGGVPLLEVLDRVGNVVESLNDMTLLDFGFDGPESVAFNVRRLYHNSRDLIEILGRRWNKGHHDVQTKLHRRTRAKANRFLQRSIRHSTDESEQSGGENDDDDVAQIHRLLSNRVAKHMKRRSVETLSTEEESDPMIQQLHERLHLQVSDAIMTLKRHLEKRGQSHAEEIQRKTIADGRLDGWMMNYNTKSMGHMTKHRDAVHSVRYFENTCLPPGTTRGFLLSQLERSQDSLLSSSVRLYLQALFDCSASRVQIRRTLALAAQYTWVHFVTNNADHLKKVISFRSGQLTRCKQIMGDMLPNIRQSAWDNLVKRLIDEETRKMYETELKMRKTGESREPKQKQRHSNGTKYEPSSLAFATARLVAVELLKRDAQQEFTRQFKLFEKRVRKALSISLKEQLYRFIVAQYLPLNCRNRLEENVRIRQTCFAIYRHVEQFLEQGLTVDIANEHIPLEGGAFDEILTMWIESDRSATFLDVLHLRSMFKKLFPRHIGNRLLPECIRMDDARSRAGQTDEKQWQVLVDSRQLQLLQDRIPTFLQVLKLSNEVFAAHPSSTSKNGHVFSCIARFYPRHVKRVALDSVAQSLSGITVSNALERALSAFWTVRHDFSNYVHRLLLGKDIEQSVRIALDEEQQITRDSADYLAYERRIMERELDKCHRCPSLLFKLFLSFAYRDHPVEYAIVVLCRRVRLVSATLDDGMFPSICKKTRESQRLSMILSEQFSIEMWIFSLWHIHTRVDRSEHWCLKKAMSACRKAYPAIVKMVEHYNEYEDGSGRLPVSILEMLMEYEQQWAHTIEQFIKSRGDQQDNAIKVVLSGSSESDRETLQRDVMQRARQTFDPTSPQPVLIRADMLLLTRTQLMQLGAIMSLLDLKASDLDPYNAESVIAFIDQKRRARSNEHLQKRGGMHLE